MDTVGAYRSSLYQRSESLLQPATHPNDALRTKPLFSPGSSPAQILIGLNALSLLVVMSWVVFARIRRRVLSTVNHFLGVYLLPPMDFGELPQDDAVKKSKLVVSKKELEELVEVDWQEDWDVGNGLGDSQKAVFDDDTDLDDYEVILGDDAADNELHAD